MGPLSGQFNLQFGPDQGEASQRATARAGAEQGLNCPAVMATTRVLERRLAVTSTPGDQMPPCQKTIGSPASWAVAAHSVCSAWS